MRFPLVISTIVAVGCVLTGSAGWAQSPTVPQPDTLQSESTGPQDPRSTGSTTRSNEPLSNRLGETGGVIRPRDDVAPDIAIRPPDPGTTRVIPPPGSPGGNQAVNPR